MKVTRLLVAAAVALLVSGIFSTPALDRVENLSLDSLFWLRHIAWGPRHNPDDSNVVVIAIDEETYRAAPFRDVPKVMWTKQIGEVIDSVRTAGASIIGFDIIFPTSVEPFIRGYDRDFMLSLRRAFCYLVELQRQQLLGRPQLLLVPDSNYLCVDEHHLF